MVVTMISGFAKLITLLPRYDKQKKVISKFQQVSGIIISLFADDDFFVYQLTL